MFYDGLNMDYFIGFLVGYCSTSFISVLKRLTQPNYTSTYTEDELYPLSEDDLP
jgi:hypothetical protein